MLIDIFQDLLYLHIVMVNKILEVSQPIIITGPEKHIVVGPNFHPSVQTTEGRTGSWN